MGSFAFVIIKRCSGMSGNDSPIVVHDLDVEKLSAPRERQYDDDAAKLFVYPDIIYHRIRTIQPLLIADEFFLWL